MLKKINIKDLTPYDKNPRINDKAVDKVLQSLNDNGYIAPIIVSEVGHPFGQHVICAGHTRYKALKKFGAKEVQCFVHKFDTEEAFVRYNIQDNKTSEFAEWDEVVLDELSSQFDIDLKAMDFEFEMDSDEYGEDFTLPDGDKEPFQQITFTLADEQAEFIKAMLKEAPEGETYGNENSNGNAIYSIVSEWAEQRT